MVRPKTTRYVDVGICTSTGVLAGKLEDVRPGVKNEGFWNVKRVPMRLGEPGVRGRLFFATNGYWRGYFALDTNVVPNRGDTEKPYALIFYLDTWTEIEKIPVKAFRGFRYLEGMP